MAKAMFMIAALMTLHAWVHALPNVADESATAKSEYSIPHEQTGPTLDGEQYRITEAPEDIDDKSSQGGQRRKRFYKYFSFGFSPYDSFNPHFFQRDQHTQTDPAGTEDSLAQILKRVQEILTYTRQQANNPPPAPQYPPPLYIPVFYVPQSGCGCTSDNNETPSYGSETTPTTNMTPQTLPAHDNATVTPSPNDDTSNTTPDFFTRLSEGMGNVDDNDGARPISFVPIKPKVPLSRPPPPVDHGSSQSETSVAEIEASRVTTEPPQANALPAQPHLPTNSIPTLCDGAVLSCCHRAEVTIACFVKQGCRDLSPYEEPCSANVILEVIRKFQYYYANRRG